MSHKCRHNTCIESIISNSNMREYDPQAQVYISAILWILAICSAVPSLSDVLLPAQRSVTGSHA